MEGLAREKGRTERRGKGKNRELGLDEGFI
jgi:hypothetical protein